MDEVVESGDRNRAEVRADPPVSVTNEMPSRNSPHDQGLGPGTESAVFLA